jgi:hypothetical protein
LAGIGFATADVAADIFHLGDLVSGVGGTVLSLGIQAGTSAGQILIETERIEEKMRELQEEIAKTGKIPSDGRLHDYYDLDDDAIKEIRATVGSQLAAVPTSANSTASSTPPGSLMPGVALSPKASALLGAIGPPGARRDWKEAVRLSGLAAQEVVAVARACGVRPAADVIDQIQRAIDALPPAHMTSMHEEIIGGRPSELEYWSGAVVRLGREAGVATPLNEFIYYSLLPQERQARGQV